MHQIINSSLVNHSSSTAAEESLIVKLARGQMERNQNDISRIGGLGNLAGIRGLNGLNTIAQNSGSKGGTTGAAGLFGLDGAMSASQTTYDKNLVSQDKSARNESKD